jgi:hypothetical protein
VVVAFSFLGVRYINRVLGALASFLFCVVRADPEYGVVVHLPTELALVLRLVVIHDLQVLTLFLCAMVQPAGAGTELKLRLLRRVYKVGAFVHFTGYAVRVTELVLLNGSHASGFFLGDSVMRVPPYGMQRVVDFMGHLFLFYFIFIYILFIITLLLLYLYHK